MHMVAVPSYMSVCLVPLATREVTGFSGTDAFDLPWVGAGNGTPGLVEE